MEVDTSFNVLGLKCSQIVNVVVSNRGTLSVLRNRDVFPLKFSSLPQMDSVNRINFCLILDINIGDNIKQTKFVVCYESIKRELQIRPIYMSVGVMKD